MSKWILYIVFIIYCANQAQNAGGGGGGGGPAGAAGAAAEVVTNYRADKLWDDDLLMETMQVEESTLTNCDTMENGRLFILKEKPLLLMADTVNLMKWN
uniref:Bm10172 n=1 Tax=Brugia malayi TaxID=6279 RepID=A0A0J9XXH1_BRUMA|nr:Bm10172 [Brugia malayi]